MELVLNKKYTLTTKELTLEKIVVKVVGIINYSQAQSVAYNVKTLAINEKVIDEEDDPDSFLQDLTFYHLKPVDETDTREWVVWADIIDSVQTNLLDATYSYRLKVTISSDLNVPIATIIDNIESYLASTYGTSVTPDITAIVGDDSTESELLATKVARYETLLQSLDSLTSVLNLIQRIADADVEEQMTSIQSDITQIQSDLSKISSAL